MTASGSVTFRSSTLRGRMEVPVKGTFIHFDVPLSVPRALRRSYTCPSLQHPDLCADTSASDLCHAMIPQDMFSAIAVKMSAAVASEAAAKKQAVIKAHAKTAVKPRSGADCDPRESSPDGISDASTKESSGAPSTPQNTDHDILPTWTSIPSRKKKLGGRDTEQPEAQEQAAPVPMQFRGKGQGRGPIEPSYPAQRPESSYAAQRPEAKGKGKGKGLSHFERIEVGVEDDEDFHVVQRLIGPRGKHMQDITAQAYGAKVWIIGRGSRSWEDSTGPLMICVGAGQKHSFDTAVTLIRDLLNRVREDHKAFRGH